MTAAGTVEKALGAFEAADFRHAASFLTDDFIVTGVLDEAMNGNEFLGLMKGLIGALPDFSFNIGSVQEEGDRVRLKTHIRGTHTAALNLGAVGLGTVKPTNLEVVLPEITVEFAVRDGKIASAKVFPVPGDTVREMLAQVGVDISTRVGSF